MIETRPLERHDRVAPRASSRHVRRPAMCLVRRWPCPVLHEVRPRAWSCSLPCSAHVRVPSRALSHLVCRPPVCVALSRSLYPVSRPVCCPAVCLVRSYALSRPWRWPAFCVPPCLLSCGVRCPPLRVVPPGVVQYPIVSRRCITALRPNTGHSAALRSQRSCGANHPLNTEVGRRGVMTPIVKYTC